MRLQIPYYPLISKWQTPMQKKRSTNTSIGIDTMDTTKNIKRISTGREVGVEANRI